MAHADDYPIVIRRTTNGYIAEASALGLTRTGPDVKVLEAAVRASVEEILAVCDRHGAQIDPARDLGTTVSRSDPHRRRMVAAMAAVLVVAIISMPLMWGFQRVSAFMSSAEQFTSARMEKILTSGVRQTADTLEMITPERRDQLSHDFGRIARALEPYAAQLRPLLVSSQSAPQPSAGDRRP